MEMLSTSVATGSKPQGRENKPAIIDNLYHVFAEERRSLIEVTWEQQRLHEARRWNVTEMVEAVDLEALSPIDKLSVWHAGRAELTTKPGADRLAHLSDVECRKWIGKNSALANVLQACGTWSRYWNEEEAHHETSFNRISTALKLEPIGDDTFLDYRKIFPDDDMLRTLMLLSISEITAAVNYANGARIANDPGLKALIKQVGADEVQHMTYFTAFAKALVDSGEYPAKHAFAVAHFFLREDGDLRGSHRQQIEQRNTHVNWWDHLESSLTVTENFQRKEGMICGALERITGIKVKSAAEVEEAWMELVGG
jgi:hypothetical protein